MKIIYHCYGGAHSSVTAAAIHLGQLPEDSIPAVKDFEKLKLYDWQTQNEHGNIYYIGTDKYNNEIYILGRRKMAETLNILLKDLYSIFNIDSNIMLVDASKHINLIMCIGGILSRRLNFVKLGKSIVIRGTQKSYPYLVALVREVKKRWEPGYEKNIIL
ncbi:DUF3189 family protein [Desulfolucanica intricata]|uniref:DUF3189 family protein n=1 Tax=Desulfolucanica intricata TaxID=1285191 RepID=UPI0008379B94|nr:DUF3189 family protein [Desulfolucanica intricata]